MTKEQNKSRWDSLTMAQKSELIGMAVKQGITDLSSIKSMYNEMGVGSRRYEIGGFMESTEEEKDLYYTNSIGKQQRFVRHPNESYEDYKHRFEERQKLTQQRAQRNRDRYNRRMEANARGAERLNHSINVVTDAMKKQAEATPFTGAEVKQAAEEQRQDKIDEWHGYKNMIDATMTGAEMLAAGYGITRGLTHLNRYLARNATQSTGQAVSRDAMQNLLKWNNRVDMIDKPQVAMNAIGGTADGYQLLTADNSFDRWENGIETGMNAAGVVGGMNWFRNLPIYTKFGNRVDNALDAMGYGAAIWDISKNIPPLSWTLDNIRQQFISEENNIEN